MALHASVFWLDQRTPYYEADPAERMGLLDATGGVVCFDGTVGTGFIVDISRYVAGDVRFAVLATTARVLYNGDTGESRGRCAFRPSSAPHHYLRIGEHLVGAQNVGSLDENDWAFAKLESRVKLPPGLRIDFDGSRDLDALQAAQIYAVGFVRDWRLVAVASDCKLGAQRAPRKSPMPAAIPAHLVLHGCDVLGSSRGGPLAVLEDGAYRVIAVNAGESQEEKYPDLTGIPYDPQRNFFNYSRRFDKELEDKLVAFVSRFAEVKSPSAAIKARRILIRNIQTELNRLGFDAGQADGLMGQRTADAVKSFQTTIGITPTGKVSEELLLLLKGK